VLRVRHDRVVAKTIEPAQGGDPNISFAIFEERSNEIAGESISLRKYVGASVMEMNNTGSRGSNPDASIAVPENSCPIDVACLSGVRMLGFKFPAPELSEPSRQRNQKASIGGLTQVWYYGRPKWHAIEPGGPGPPSPNSVRRHHPEHVVAIFIEETYSLREGAARFMAVTICSIDRAELSRGRQRGASDPHRSVAIFKNRSDKQASKIRVPSEFAISPARQASHCADPESAVAGDMEAHDKIAGKLFAIQRWLPMLDADAVEPKQPEAGAQPYVAVWRLRNRPDVALRETLANLPHRVSVLTHVE
jgi:hypothetical protein